MGVLDKFLKKEKQDFSVDPNSLVKKKQVKILLIVFVTVIFFAFYLNKSSPDVEPTSASSEPSLQVSNDAVRKNFDSSSGVRVEDRDIWMSSGIRKIEELSRKQEELQEEAKKRDEQFKAEMESRLTETNQEVVSSLNTEIESLKAMIEELKEQNEKLASRPEPSQAKELTVVSGAEVAESVKKPLVVQNRFFPSGEYVVDQERPFSSGSVTTPVERPSMPEKPSFQQPIPSKLKSVSLISENDSESIDEVAPEVKRNPLKKADTYIPAGTFFPAVLLGGVDAPTGGQAQNNPHPVFLMIDDLAFLPNRYRYDVKECRLIGHSYGDLNSERAIMRLETLSCIDDEGHVFEKRVKGHVFGEDGKAGVRGRVVEKTGQLLMRSLVAGVASGIGTAFQQQAMTYSTSPLGTTSTINPDQVAVAGVGTGIGRGLDRLSQYYIDLAEKLFPVIEVGSQRVVDVVLTEGIDWLEVDEDDEQIVADATNRTVGIVNQAIQSSGAAGQQR